MGILLGFLSCQKDSDKACPHLATIESLTSPVGEPIETCDEPVTINLYTVTYQRNEYGTIIDSVFDTSLKAVVYHYNKTVFIKFS